MSNHKEDKIWRKLYQQSKNEQPPKAIDDLILQHAKAEITKNKSFSRNKWRPWLAAASVVLVLPLIWLLTQNNELIDTEALDTPMLAPKPIQAAPVEQGIEVELIELDDLKEYEEMEQAAPSTTQRKSATADIIESTATNSRLKAESLNANRHLLMDELKASKKTIKQQNLDPIMALELQQFHQYIENNQLEMAEQLLADMRHSYPDFNYDELIHLLAETKPVEKLPH